MLGFLQVSDGHQLYYERVGKPGGTPVLFVHGGPGSGFTQRHKKLFDPNRFDAVFYDQRGSGKSRPYLSLEGNTTQNLIDNIEKLRAHLKIEKWVLAGASWGATLALLYAEAYPGRVAGLSLMSIFLATHAESLRFVDGSTADTFPEIWNRFAAFVPLDFRSNIAAYYLERMRTGTDTEQERAAYLWALYDIALSTGEYSEEVLAPVVRALSYRSLALMTAYYIENDFFLSENAILQNAGAIARIPLSIVQGSRDPITPPEAAQKLHQALPRSRLFMYEDFHVGEQLVNQFVSETARLCGV